MSYLLYGVSEELQGAIDALRWAPSMRREGNKYRDKDINSLAQMLLCRNYGKATLELSYLLLAVALKEPIGTEKAWLNFFWLEENITPNGFKKAFSNLPDSVNKVLTQTDEGIKITLQNSHFKISPSRVGVLASLLEFVTYIAPSLLKQPPAYYANPSVSAVKEFASTLQKTLYDYLGEHIQAAQQQRRFRKLWGWLQQYNNEASLQINDEAIQAFWLQCAQEMDDQLGFRRYRTVAENFFDLHDAINVVDNQQQISRAQAIGHNAEAGEISPERLEKTLEIMTSQTLNIASLAQNPKYLTKQQVESLQAVNNNPLAAVKLPITIMRMSCFGDWQAQLVQALRNKKQQQIKTYLEGMPQNYSDYISSYTQLSQALHQAIDSGLHLLFFKQHPAALAMIISRLPEESRQLLQIEIDRLNKGAENNLNKTIFNQWAELKLKIPALNHQQQQLEKAFKANNRQGFKQLTDTIEPENYSSGIETLSQLVKQNNNHLKSVQSIFLEQDIQEKYSADLCIYKEVFSALYGGHK